MEANYGILALIPPVVAIGLCFATKQVLISMFAGIFAGALVISNWNPLAAASYSLDALATNMADNVVLLLFTLFMGVGIAFIWRLGGSYALAEAAKKRFKKRRSVCLGTWGLGMVCSVNDCLVAAVDGNVFRDTVRITGSLPRNSPMFLTPPQLRPQHSSFLTGSLTRSV